MGNLLACCATPSKANDPNPSGRPLPAQWRFFEVYEPFQLSPSPLKLASSSGGVRGASDAAAPELRDKIDPRSLDFLKELNFSSLKQPSFSCLKQQNIGNPQKRVTFDPIVTTYEVAPFAEGLSISAKDTQEVENIPTYPPNHRYQNCSRTGDDDSDEHYYGGSEEDEDVFDDCSEDGDCEYFTDRGVQEEESSDSLFSLQMDQDWEIFKEVNSAKATSTSSPDQKQLVAHDRSVQNRSNHVASVLNPVENLSQWRQAKAVKAPAKHLNKENNNQSKVPRKCTKQTDDLNRHLNLCNGQELSVETSFSSWLQTPRAASLTSHRESCCSQRDSCSGSTTSSILDDHPSSCNFSLLGMEN